MAGVPLSKKKALYGTPQVGKDTLTYCSRCDMELAHVIVSMVEGVPSKVICNTCKSPHKFRRRSSVKTPGTRRSAAANKSTRMVKRMAEIWEEKMAERKKDVTRSYEVDQTFETGDVIQHTKFGLGMIEEVRPGDKVLVLFRDAERVLIHGKKAG